MSEKTIIQKDFTEKAENGFQQVKFGQNASILICITVLSFEKCRTTFQEIGFQGFFGDWHCAIIRLNMVFKFIQKLKLGKVFILGHWGTVVINPKTKIGKNCNIMQGVTIAQANRGEI